MSWPEGMPQRDRMWVRKEAFKWKWILRKERIQRTPTYQRLAGVVGSLYTRWDRSALHTRWLRIRYGRRRRSST